MNFSPIYTMAAQVSDVAIIGTAIGSIGALLVGLAALLTRGDAVKRAKVDYHETLMGAFKGHMDTLAGENTSLRNRVDELDKQVRKCQNDKFEMSQALADWERKWEAKINEGTTGTT